MSSFRYTNLLPQWHRPWRPWGELWPFLWSWVQRILQGWPQIWKHHLNWKARQRGKLNRGHCGRKNIKVTLNVNLKLFFSHVCLYIKLYFPSLLRNKILLTFLSALRMGKARYQFKFSVTLCQSMIHMNQYVFEFIGCLCFFSGCGKSHNICNGHKWWKAWIPKLACIHWCIGSKLAKCWCAF